MIFRRWTGFDSRPSSATRSQRDSKSRSEARESNVDPVQGGREQRFIYMKQGAGETVGVIRLAAVQLARLKLAGGCAG